MTRYDPERRKHPRIAPKGAVTLSVGPVVGPVVIVGRIANLSRSGLLVETRVSAPERLLGRPTSVEIRLDGQQAEWLRASGRIMRIEASGVAVALDSVSDALGTMVDEASSQSHAHRRAINVVLIDGDQTRSDAMVEGFRSAGCVVQRAKTPLEAIVHLGESAFEPDLVAIGDTAGTSAEELRSFVAKHHPRARLVAIGTDTASEATGPWLSSDDPIADLPVRIRLVLGRSR
jgi:hypothetical protein